MALNRFMHPRNVYRTPPDFKELAVKYPEFRRHAVQDLSGNLHVDFKNADALRALTRALLKKDFDLDVNIPKDRLIPTVPLRLNYILWIEDLLGALPTCEGEKMINGFDIGTGTSCIYPLLGARRNGWHFVATESDAEACGSAQRNVAANGLDGRIEVLRVAPDCAILDAVQQTGRRFHFSMCNPPFFLNELDARPEGKGRSAFRPPPRGANSPSQNEAVTAGGEVSLVRKMIEDSLILKETVKIYTTMLGKKQSLGEVKRLLHDLGGKAVASICQTEFCQGHTMRWGIAWTFCPEIALDQVQRPREKPTKPLIFELPGEFGGLEEVLHRVREILRELKISFTELKHGSSAVSLRCIASEDTWSNQRRKRRALKRETVIDSNGKCGDQRPVENDGFPEAAKKAKTEQTSEGNGLRCHSTATLELSSTRGPASGDELSPAAVCLLTLHRSGSASAVGIQWLEGTLGKDAAQQILQYFKNRLK